MTRIDASKLDRADRDRLVMMASSEGAKQFRKLLRNFTDVLKDNLVVAPNERLAGYIQGVQDICGILDIGGREVQYQKRMIQSSEPSNEMRGWTQ